jgi:hypothetical protein
MNPTLPEHLHGTMHGFSSVDSLPQQNLQVGVLSGLVSFSSVMTGLASLSSCMYNSSAVCPMNSHLKSFTLNFTLPNFMTSNFLIL